MEEQVLAKPGIAYFGKSSGSINREMLVLKCADNEKTILPVAT